jgi:protein ImuB
MFAAVHAPGNIQLLLDCAEHFSPLVEETSKDTIVFDIRGLKLIYGAPEHIAAEIQRRIAIPANIGIAANPDAAIHAARGLAGITILSQGRESSGLAPLPLHLLGGSPEFARTLDSWGIRNFGEFAALPPIGVISRLGDEGARLQRLACGQGNRLLRLRIDPLAFQETRELDDAIHIQEPLLEVVSQLLDTLFDRLRFHALSTNELRLTLTLERRKPEHAIQLRLPVPMRDAQVLLKLLHLELDNRPPAAPVAKIHLELIPAEARSAQHGMFLPAAPEPEKLAITLARIRNLVGAANVGAPELLNTYRPDSFTLGVITAARTERPATVPTIVLRRFRPPRTLQVRLNNEGHPAALLWSGETQTVLACAGPWHASGEWWTPTAWSRQEWDVELSGGGLFRLYLDRMMGRWFLEGSYD